MHDRLTGLPGRRAFQRKLDRRLASRRDSRAGVFHIDLDRFEAVNQALGRSAGDDLLHQVAGRLRTFGKDGCFVARLGSDRFGVLTDDPEAVMDLAKNAIALLAEPFLVGAQQVTITASAGVVSDSPGVDAIDMMSSANVALQWAKSDGRATCRRFEPTRNALEIKRYQLWLALPSAMACEQIALHYQPLVDLRSGQVIGAEALARWTHPEFGEIPPETFIGIAEETGHIIGLGAMLLRQACTAATTWKSRGKGPAPYVSVNVAAAQLHHPSFVTTVTTTLAHSGLHPQRLQLEITEHSLVGTSPHTLKSLRSLRRLGVRIAVDDFGTGYSNLAALLTLPVHELKLAHALVQDGSPDLLNNIMQLGRTLKLTMTAEGVETEGQADLMRTLGCDTGQGWHFSRPMTAEGIRRYLCVNPPLAGRRPRWSARR